jgi:hypothetical protein
MRYNIDSFWRRSGRKSRTQRIRENAIYFSSKKEIRDFIYDQFERETDLWYRLHNVKRIDGLAGRINLMKECRAYKDLFIK